MVFFELLIKPLTHWHGGTWVLTGQYELPFSYDDVTKHPFGSYWHIRCIQYENLRLTLHPVMGTGVPKRPKRGTFISSDIWLLRHRELPHVLATSPSRVMISPSVQGRTRTGKLRSIIAYTTSLFKT